MRACQGSISADELVLISRTFVKVVRGIVAE